MTDREIDRTLASPLGVAIKQDADGFEIVATTRSVSTALLGAFAFAWFAVGLVLIFRNSGKSVVFVTILMSFGGIPLVVCLLASYFGKMAIGCRGASGWVTHGTGFSGHIERFSWDEIDTIETGHILVDYYEGTHPAKVPVLFLKGPNRQITFGKELSVERRSFLIRALVHLRGLKRQGERLQSPNWTPPLKHWENG